MNPYETLGVSKDASQKDIKAAYRAKALSTHPDQNEGKEDEFKLASLAYETLGDEEKRKRYDETGKTANDNSPTLEEVARDKVTMLFYQMINDPGFDPERHDPFERLKTYLSRSLGKLEIMISDQEKQISKLNKALEKPKKGTNVEFFKQLISNSIIKVEQDISNTKKGIEVTEACASFVEDCEWEDLAPEESNAHANFQAQFNSIFGGYK